MAPLGRRNWRACCAGSARQRDGRQSVAGRRETPRARVLDADGAFASLETNRNGLTDDEVDARRVRYGRNEVAHEKPPTWYAELARAFANPFNFLLTILAVVSGLTGDHEAMVVIGVMVVFSTGLRFVQEFRSNKAALALRALVRTNTAVERAGDEFDPASAPVTAATRDPDR